jgi:hypothetical protein
MPGSAITGLLPMGPGIHLSLVALSISNLLCFIESSESCDAILALCKEWANFSLQGMLAFAMESTRFEVDKAQFLGWNAAPAEQGNLSREYWLRVMWVMPLFGEHRANCLPILRVHGSVE